MTRRRPRWRSSSRCCSPRSRTSACAPTARRSFIRDRRDQRARLGAEAGMVDFVEFCRVLTNYTSSRCLLGKEFREGMNSEFRRRLSRPGEGRNTAGLYQRPPADSVVPQARQSAREDGRDDQRYRQRASSRRAHRRGFFADADGVALLRRARAVRARDHRHAAGRNVRRAPHQLGDHGVDAHRASAQPGGARARGGRGRPRVRPGRRKALPQRRAARADLSRERGEGGAAPASAAVHAGTRGQEGLCV